MINMKKSLLIFCFISNFMFCSESSSSNGEEKSRYTFLAKFADWWRGHYSTLLAEIRSNQWDPDLDTDAIHRAERAIEGGIKANDPNGLNELLEFCVAKSLPLNPLYIEQAREFFKSKLEQEKQLAAQDISDSCERLRAAEKRYLKCINCLGSKESSQLETTESALQQLHRENLLK